jgi:hypothetical protein
MEGQHTGGASGVGAAASTAAVSAAGWRWRWRSGRGSEGQRGETFITERAAWIKSLDFNGLGLAKTVPVVVKRPGKKSYLRRQNLDNGGHAAGPLCGRPA